MNATLWHPLRPFSTLPAVALVATLSTAAPLSLAAQSAPDVLRTAVERYEARHEGIDNYTLVQTVMGFESTTYFERDTIDGRVVFLPQSTTGSEATQPMPESPWASFAELEERAEHAGFETIDDVRAHVIEITDLEGLELWSPSPAAVQFQPGMLTLLIGEDDSLLRKMVMTGSTAPGGPQNVTFTALFSDYRDVDGLTHPFRTEFDVEGLQSQLSEEEMASMQEMMQQMQNMPEAQQEMMRRMMGDQFEQIERMLGEATMARTIEIKEIRVNAGPPGGV